MSIVLEFIGINLDTVKSFFDAGDSSILTSVIAEGKEIYDGDDNDEETQEERFVWEEIANSLSGGKLGKYLSTQKSFGIMTDKNDPVSEMKTLAITSVVRNIGKSIGGVYHANNSGDAFRSEPFAYLNQSGFLGRIDSYILLQRPFFNLIHDGIPGIGGLTRTELESIQMDKLMIAKPASGDTDVDSWVSGILDLIEEVKLRELDLVTIYE